MPAPAKKPRRTPKTVPTRVGTNKFMTVDGRAHFTSPPGLTALFPGDSITVVLAHFHMDSSIDTVTIFHNEVEHGLSRPGAEICSWRRNGPNRCEKLFDITAQGETQVMITNVSTAKTEERYWFSISGTRGDTFWGVDPELINRPSG